MFDAAGSKDHLERDVGVVVVGQVAIENALLAQEELRRKRLVTVLAGWRQLDAPILLVHRVGQQKVRRVRAFLDFVQAERS